MFYLNSTLNFGIPPVLVFQLEVYYVVDRLLAGLTAQQKGTTARWYLNKTSLIYCIKQKSMDNNKRNYYVVVWQRRGTKFSEPPFKVFSAVHEIHH